MALEHTPGAAEGRVGGQGSAVGGAPVPLTQEEMRAARAEAAVRREAARIAAAAAVQRDHPLARDECLRCGPTAIVRSTAEPPSRRGRR